MSNNIKTKFVLFTDTRPEKIKKYRDLAALAYNDSPVPGGLTEEIKIGVELTARLAREAETTGTSVENLLTNNLSAIPITYALINEENGEMLGIGCILNSDYIRKRSKQGNNPKLAKDMEAHPNSWGCLEYMCLLPEVQGGGLGRILMNGLYEAADKLGLKNVAVICAEDRFGFYEKVGLNFSAYGSVIHDKWLRRAKLADLIPEDVGAEIVAGDVTLKQVLGFLDKLDKETDVKRAAEREKMTKKIGHPLSTRKTKRINRRIRDITPPVRINGALVVGNVRCLTQKRPEMR